MSGLPRRAKQKPKVPENELSSFFNTSESESDSCEDDEWEPERKVTNNKKMPVSSATKPKKEKTAKETATKKKRVTGARAKKAVLKSDNLIPNNNQEFTNSEYPASESACTYEGTMAKPDIESIIQQEQLSIISDKEGTQNIPGELKKVKIKQENNLKKKPIKKPATPRQRKPKAVKVKEERKSLNNDELPSTSTQQKDLNMKEEQLEDDFTFGEPPLKKMKSISSPQGKPVKHNVKSNSVLGECQMNWNLAQVLSERTNVELWVCSNLIQLFQDENTIPFIARYRKELINNLDADALREVHHALEELRAVAKKAHMISQKLKKEGKLSACLHTALLNCRTSEEIDHVYAPFKTGSKGTKAQRARQLGLEPATLALLTNPVELNLFSYVKPNVEGISTVGDVQTGVQHILADMIAKDKETLEYIRNLCKHNYISVQSSLAKATSKEGNVKDVDKYQLYHNFTCNISRIQHHQILAINRGENHKVLTVKVNVPDRMKDEFSRWCVNQRWRPQRYARPELMNILRNSVEDSYKRLIFPLLCREFRSKLTSDAEKESVMMFGRNLRQLLLMTPVRGRTLMGVDPGYKHGCKLAIISPTNQILHVETVYLHTGQGFREAEKIRGLLLNYNCFTVVIGNGTACRETERYFADLIQKKYFAPLDVVYCIANEAGASIYSVSPEAVKEMPDLDPNLRSAVSIARRVQDPLAELVKIEPKHIGVGMYQHDAPQTLLKATLDSVVEECVSFVGVDINICSEILLRHIAGLNATRAKNIIEWREKNGPFINRDQLKSVKGLGPKTFQQCAGFIRFNQEYIRNICRSQQCEPKAEGQAHRTGITTKAGVEVKKRNKSAANVKLQPNPLDQTCIHPESYDIAKRFLMLIGGISDDIGKPEMQNSVNKIIFAEGMAKIAQNLKTTEQTLQIIIDGLCQPEGFDIRTEFDQPDFKRTIVCLEDLQVGTILTGKVENATLFGVFVDIGVGKAGLIPMRYITQVKLSQDKKRRSLGLGPGERVEVKVINVDIRQSRITLDLIRVL
nr:S1 RNA-binding domain-containing protein 1 isoform X2 [Geotrypetes seraphini]XP_033791634.1 S1 RNA-binding domain-containing protein 1 isoform X2 [Geotrypetes seraphini]XP_033791635.1 S1 RNA-binding domain-containing protein 1 isoform X2 [Geotrypetes seraphini]XP_033791636.1 S1 RNA-binding domain-containing protein 1 isoform X2 [Geotrypetes seraphini]XP_033791637.1 S1 RNA-binding domain-containing protein 1 isoform X2 [Geotrypetes seraphini]XP_033791638.1 S1 RNA-binding domain-containing pr